ncbi:MAG: peptidylprolyl isomerase [Planctomycetota bacterium]|jgi:cyclophilin family peptidyl-prolyl cis-trans isomerase
MPTTRWTVASVSALLALAALTHAQDKPAPPAPPALVVPAGKAPVIDGDIGLEEWQAAATFEVKRRGDLVGHGRVLRSGRRLSVAYSSSLHALNLGVRLKFVDPVADRTTTVLVTPLDLQRSPLAVYRERGERAADRLPSATARARFRFRDDGFDAECAFPLDLLEFARSQKTYRFSVQVWDLASSRVLAVYPLVKAGPTAGGGAAELKPEGDWGADTEIGAKEKPDPALDLLDRLEVEARGEGPPVLAGYTGGPDGRRTIEPLDKINSTLATLMQAYPDYVALVSFRIRAEMGRGQFDAALELFEAIEKKFPLLRRTEWGFLVRAELLRAVGDYEGGLKHVTGPVGAVRDKGNAERTRRMFAGLAEAWALEQELRAQEAKKDDLPRVSFKTNRGTFVLELFEDDAPNAVANFIRLVGEGFYDGLRFHYSVGGRVFGGDPNSRNEARHDDGFGDPGYMIESEPSRRAPFPFTVAFADKRYRMRTEGSTFVIHITPMPELDGRNSVFGRVIEGHDVVRSISYYDTIEQATVVRKRAHEYKVTTRPK